MTDVRPIIEKHTVPEPPEDGCLSERQTVAVATLVTVAWSVKRCCHRATPPADETSGATD